MLKFKLAVFLYALNDLVQKPLVDLVALDEFIAGATNGYQACNNEEENEIFFSSQDGFPS